MKTTKENIWAPFYTVKLLDSDISCWMRKRQLSPEEWTLSGLQIIPEVDEPSTRDSVTEADISFGEKRRNSSMEKIGK